MYVIDFFRNLFKRSNFGAIIYLVLNTILLLLIFGSEDIRGFFAVLAVYFCSLAVALSPVGEFILRLQTGSKVIKRVDVSNKIQPIFDRVYQKAKQKDNSIANDIKLFINYDPMPNAFAVGRKTVCITSGLLDLPDEEIEAILAHEFAHLAHKDTDLLLAISVGNFIVTGFFLIIRVIMNITAIFLGEDGFGAVIGSAMIGLFMWIWTKIGMALVMHSSRQNEFDADEFAYHLGYGNELASALDRLVGHEPQAKLLKAVYSTHPNVNDRIGKLQTLGATYSAI